MPTYRSRGEPGELAYLGRLGRLGREGIEALRSGVDWEYNPLADRERPLGDVGGVLEASFAGGLWRAEWHVDGARVSDGRVHHVCHRGSDERGWYARPIAVTAPGFPERWRWCLDDELRWQSWRPYYQYVIDSGRDPLGLYRDTVRDLAWRDLADLKTTLPAHVAPGAEPPPLRELHGRRIG